MKRFIAFIVFIPFMPLITLVAAGFGLYRLIVSLILRCRHGERWVGLLDGADAMWEVNEDVSNGVIHALSFVEEISSNNSSSDVPSTILNILRERFKELQRSKGDQFRKMFLKRNCAFGYYYWTDELEWKCDEFIRFMNTETLGKEKYHMTNIEIQQFVNEISITKLPANHTSSLEIQIGTLPMIDSDNNKSKFPVLFRFHHSLGDGVSIMRFMLEEIVNHNVEWKFSPTPGKVADPSCRKMLKICATALYEIPLYLLRTIFQKQPPNGLRTGSSIPEKLACWQSESNSLTRSRFLQLMEEIKQVSPRIQYSSAIMLALSSVLHAYFDSRGQSRKSLTIAMPLRMTREEQYLKLRNAFSTPMQQLPIIPGIQIDDPNRQYSLISKLHAITKITNILRSSSDVLITYWIMTVIPAIFPKCILRLLSTQFRIEASISVMPELTNKVKIGPYEMQDLIFWPPAFGSVALNVAVFTYAGQLQLSLLADRTIVESIQDGHEWLNDLFREIERMNVVLKE